MGEISMSGKRSLSQSRLAQAPQDPGEMVKSELIEPQSPRCKVSRPDHNGYTSGCLLDTAKLSQLRQRILRRTGCNEQPQGLERGTFIALLSIAYETRDRLRDESPRVTETP